MDWGAMDEDEYSEKLAYYLSIGALELAGVDEDGEIVYEITDKAETEAPELWEMHQDYVDEALIGLYEEGYLNVEYDDNLEATISLTPEGVEIAKELGLLDFDEDFPND
jgi:hypothetical protein